MTTFPQEQAWSSQQFSFIPIATTFSGFFCSIYFVILLSYQLAENQLYRFSMKKIWFNIQCNVPTQVKPGDSDHKRPFWREGLTKGTDYLFQERHSDYGNMYFSSKTPRSLSKILFKFYFKWTSKASAVWLHTYHFRPSRKCFNRLMITKVIQRAAMLQIFSVWMLFFCALGSIIHLFAKGISITCSFRDWSSSLFLSNRSA